MVRTPGPCLTFAETVGIPEVLQAREMRAFRMTRLAELVVILRRSGQAIRLGWWVLVLPPAPLG